MRFALALLLTSLIAGKAQAERWCAIGYEGASNCSFDSMDLCRGAVAGTGGFCMPEAPVGHRQPRPSTSRRSLPPDPLGLKIDEVNRRLDRSLEICKGCSR